MAAGSYIDLQVGEAGWLRAVRLALVALAVLSLLTVNTTWLWKGLLLGGLLLTVSLMRLQLNRSAAVKTLRLYENGMVTLILNSRVEVPAVLEDDTWATHWVSVLPVGRFDRWPSLRLPVCRSQNHPDCYRRMLTVLRLGSGNDARNGILGRP